jgi:hypothetical protein
VFIIRVRKWSWLVGIVFIDTLAQLVPPTAATAFVCVSYGLQKKIAQYVRDDTRDNR